MTLWSFRIDPYQLRHYPDTASLSALHARHTAALTGWSAPMRLISRLLPADLGVVRQGLKQRANALADLADLLQCLDLLRTGKVRQPAAAALVRERGPALVPALVSHPDHGQAVAVLEALVMQHATAAQLAWFCETTAALLWPWRWLLNQQTALDAIQALAPPLTSEHYLLVWPEYGDPTTFAQTLRHGLLLPGVEPAPLPPLLTGPYHETATALVPTLAGDPYLTILTAHELPAGQLWGYHNPWCELLAGDLPLALALDVETLPRARAIGRTADTISELEAALSLPTSANDQPTKEAHRSAHYVQERLGQQQLHQVQYAVLVAAPTQRALDQRAQRVQDQLAGWMRLERVPGAQAEYAKLFAPLHPETIRAPLVRHLALSENLACKLPWGQRKLPIAPGLLLGHDLHDNLPLFFDPWGTTGDQNAHLAVIGTAGSGKSVLLLHLALQLALSQAQVIFFDPVGKSRLLVEAVGTGAALYTLEAEPSINILDRAEPTLVRQLGVVARRLSMVLGKVMVQGEEVMYEPYPLDNQAFGALDRVLQDPKLYGTDGARLATLQRTTTPLLSDLVEALQRYAQRAKARPAEAALRLADNLEARALGSMARIFNQHTTLEWPFDSAQVVGYNFAGVDKLLLPLLYDSGFSALQHWVRNPVRQGRWPHLALLMDEFRIMASYEGLVQFMAWATKMWRNFGALCGTADQNPDTYLQTTWARYILQNVRLMFLGRQEGNAAEQIVTLYRDRLPPSAQQALSVLAAGEFLTLLGDTAHHLSVQLTDLEEEHFLPHRKEGGHGRAS